MGDGLTHEVRIEASNVDEIKQVLGLSETPRVGSEIHLADGVTFTVTDVSKSSGFVLTTIIITAVVTIATNASSALLTEWLKSRLFKDGQHTGTTALVDGQEVKPNTRNTDP